MSISVVSNGCCYALSVGAPKRSSGKHPDFSDSDTLPKPPWRERKERYIAHLAEADRSVLLGSPASSGADLSQSRMTRFIVSFLANFGISYRKDVRSEESGPAGFGKAGERCQDGDDPGQDVKGDADEKRDGRHAHAGTVLEEGHGRVHKKEREDKGHQAEHARGQFQ